VRDIEYGFSLRHFQSGKLSSRRSGSFCSGEKQNFLPKTYNICGSSFQIFMTSNTVYLLRFQGMETGELANFLNTI